MDRVFVWPPSENMDVPENYVGVTIQKLSDGGWHTGVLYRTSQKGANVLHLIHHYGNTKQKGFIHENPQSDQLCVLCAVDDVLIPAITRVFRGIYTTNKNPGLPYGFSPALNDWFDADGLLMPRPTGHGLCCQTFVLAAYQAADMPLLDPPDPLPRQDDHVWQQAILDRNSDLIKEASNRTREHFALVEANVGTPLYRSLEVAGAAKADVYPCSFAEALANGNELEPFVPQPPGGVVVAVEVAVAVPEVSEPEQQQRE